MTVTTPIRPDLTCVGLRPVRAADAAAMQAFVAALDAAARRWRFHGAVNACSGALARHLSQVDGRRHVAFVACVGDAIVGEARYVIDAGATQAELALAVTGAWQGRGVATALLDALLQRARRAGVRRLYGDVQEGNARTAAFMRRRGFEASVDGWDGVEGGVVRYERALRLAAAAPRPARWLPAWPRLWPRAAAAYAAR